MARRWNYTDSTHSVNCDYGEEVGLHWQHALSQLRLWRGGGTTLTARTQSTATMARRWDYTDSTHSVNCDYGEEVGLHWQHALSQLRLWRGGRTTLTARTQSTATMARRWDYTDSTHSVNCDYGEEVGLHWQHALSQLRLWRGGGTTLTARTQSTATMARRWDYTDSTHSVNCDYGEEVGLYWQHALSQLRLWRGGGTTLTARTQSTATMARRWDYTDSTHSVNCDYGEEVGLYWQHALSQLRLRRGGGTTLTARTQSTATMARRWDYTDSTHSVNCDYGEEVGLHWQHALSQLRLWRGGGTTLTARTQSTATMARRWDYTDSTHSVNCDYGEEVGLHWQHALSQLRLWRGGGTTLTARTQSTATMARRWDYTDSTHSVNCDYGEEVGLYWQHALSQLRLWRGGGATLTARTQSTATMARRWDYTDSTHSVNCDYGEEVGLHWQHALSQLRLWRGGRTTLTARTQSTATMARRWDYTDSTHSVNCDYGEEVGLHWQHALSQLRLWRGGGTTLTARTQSTATMARRWDYTDSTHSVNCDYGEEVGLHWQHALSQLRLWRGGGTTLTARTQSTATMARRWNYTDSTHSVNCDYGEEVGLHWQHALSHLRLWRAADNGTPPLMPSTWWALRPNVVITVIDRTKACAQNWQ